VCDKIAAKHPLLTEHPAIGFGLAECLLNLRKESLPDLEGRSLLLFRLVNGTNQIHFAIEIGLRTIHLQSLLPPLTHPVVIDGTTQPGFNGTPIIELDAMNAADQSAPSHYSGRSWEQLHRGQCYLRQRALWHLAIELGQRNSR
jgi:hypothetical protein